VERERARYEMEYLIGGIVTAALFVYLLFALLKPERF
jgi:K+-transporting ATPase KdpF subunit